MKTIIVSGMPRSGTSWLGQIVNSDPRVAFRTEPLFSLRFKNIINISSTHEEISDFFNSLIDVDDDFILQKDNQRAGYYPAFDKVKPEVLSFKTTRHHELLEKYLNCVSDVQIVGIVRHPAGAINSWLKSYKEFEKKGCVKESDWRNGGCRKSEIGEYWGFDDWLTITKQFVFLSEKYPNFYITKYSDLVRNTEKSVEELFNKMDFEILPQTRDYILQCHSRHDEDPYSVFKNRNVADKWRQELDRDIAQAIIRETERAGLSYFLR